MAVCHEYGGHSTAQRGDGAGGGSAHRSVQWIAEPVAVAIDWRGGTAAAALRAAATARRLEPDSDLDATSAAVDRRRHQRSDRRQQCLYQRSRRPVLVAVPVERPRPHTAV